MDVNNLTEAERKSLCCRLATEFGMALVDVDTLTLLEDSKRDLTALHDLLLRQHGAEKAADGSFPALAAALAQYTATLVTAQ